MDGGNNYLCMSPTQTKEGRNDGTNFQFPLASSIENSNQLRGEMTPMLLNTSSSDVEPSSPALSRVKNDISNSVENPTYHNFFDKAWAANSFAPTSTYINITPSKNTVENSSRI